MVEAFGSRALCPSPNLWQRKIKMEPYFLKERVEKKSEQVPLALSYLSSS